jgi:hypothetical protein
MIFYYVFLEQAEQIRTNQNKALILLKNHGSIKIAAGAQPCLQ